MFNHINEFFLLKIIICVSLYISIFHSRRLISLTRSTWSVGILYVHFVLNYNFVCLSLLSYNSLFLCIINYLILVSCNDFSFLCKFLLLQSFIRPRHLTLWIYSWFTSNRSFPRPWTILFVHDCIWQSLTKCQPTDNTTNANNWHL